MYPSIARASNISQETKLATVLWIGTCPYTLREVYDMYVEWQNAEKRLAKMSNPVARDKLQVSIAKRTYENMVKANSDYIDTIFGKLISPDENAVDLCHELFGLPDYSEMRRLYREQKAV